MIEKTKGILISQMQLSSKIDCDFEIYSLSNKRYLTFWDATVRKKEMQSILENLTTAMTNEQFSSWKTIIVVGETEEQFGKNELVYFNGTNTIVIFYLINTKQKKIFSNKSWIFLMGMNYRKYIKKIDFIISKNIEL